MRTLYHEFESLEHLLATRLLPGGGSQPIRFTVFGGTGAVGGAAVLELCRLILLSERLRERPFHGEIHATGLSEKEIANFARRLYLAFGERMEIEKIEPRRHYRLGGRVDLYLSLLQLELPRDLEDHIASCRHNDPDVRVEALLGEYFAAQPCPFQRFVEGLGVDLLHSVVVAIPLPSVVTYTLESIDRLLPPESTPESLRQTVKQEYLQTFIRGLAVIQQRHARRVIIAHTTAVGGMYRVDGGRAEIRLGFAHSALGQKLVEKKYFADRLTQLYIDHGFDVLVTAAAIGIDAVELRCHLPRDRDADRLLRRAVNGHHERAADTVPPIEATDLDAANLLLYPSRDLPLDEARAEQAEPAEGATPLSFGAGKELIVDAAIRSGENGLFSVANCVALYNVMKVAIPEELAMVLVRHAVFGPERRRDWFRDKVCYYSETENSYFALRLLDNYPQLIRAHHGAFAVQAYQALGSATHQARLHELGLLLLLLRLIELGDRFTELDEATLAGGLADLDSFLWEHTRIPCFEDLEGIEARRLGELFGALCEVSSMDDAGRLMGYDPRRHGRREPGREKFLSRLATGIRRYLDTVTSLGIPIIYRSETRGDRILVGPYVAPLETTVASAADLHQAWRRIAEEHDLAYPTVRRWSIVNNGFVDLRPHAFATSAKKAGPDLEQRTAAFTDAEALLAWIVDQKAGSYFTTNGLVALALRLSRLHEKVRGRRIELGTRETWKHLFKQSSSGGHILSPGLVETVRMYNEGLGKITGTEALWPSWGY